MTRDVSRCPYCLSSACVCSQCGSCGGLVFADEFSTVHVCSSNWGEHTEAWPYHAPVLEQYYGSGQAGYMPHEPTPVHTAVLHAPGPCGVSAGDHGTLATRVIKS